MTAQRLRPRDNPFRVERLESLAFRPQGTTWSALLVRLDELCFRAAIVGADGSGKTTLIEELARRLPLLGFRPMPFAFRPDSSRDAVHATIARARAAGPADVLLVDGADHLPRLDWWRLRHAARRARGLVATSHRARLLPTLIESRTSVTLLAELVRELAPEHSQSLDLRLPEVLARHRGNIRTSLLELFDEVARDTRL